MKIGKEKLGELSRLNDDELWKAIRGLAGSHGFKLPENTPQHEDLEKVRKALSGDLKLSMSDALRLMNKYKGDNR